MSDRQQYVSLALVLLATQEYGLDDKIPKHCFEKDFSGVKDISRLKLKTLLQTHSSKILGAPYVTRLDFERVWVLSHRKSGPRSLSYTDSDAANALVCRLNNIFEVAKQFCYDNKFVDNVNLAWNFCEQANVKWFYKHNPDIVKQIMSAYRFILHYFGKATVQNRWDNKGRLDNFVAVVMKMKLNLQHLRLYFDTGLPNEQYLNKLIIALFESHMAPGIPENYPDNSRQDQYHVPRKYIPFADLEVFGFSLSTIRAIVTAIYKRRVTNVQKDKEIAVQVDGYLDPRLDTEFEIPYYRLVLMLDQNSLISKEFREKSSVNPLIFSHWLLNRLNGKSLSYRRYTQLSKSFSKEAILEKARRLKALSKPRPVILPQRLLAHGKSR